MKDLLLLHGALGSEEQQAPLIELLKNDFAVHAFSFSGHGGAPFKNEPFSIALFCKDVITYLDKKNIEHADMFGYSMGGYIALYLARHYPVKVNKIFTLATKFDWTPTTAAKEASMLDPDMMEQKIPAFVASLALRHGEENWRRLVTETAGMMKAMGANNPLSQDDFQQIHAKVFLSRGDQDKMVSADETEVIHKLIPESTLITFENTPHPFEKVDLMKLAAAIKQCFL